MTEKKSISIIWQIALLFIIGILASGVLTFLSQHATSEEGVKSEREKMAAEVTDAVKTAVTEYPAHEWLLKYWYNNYDQLDIEYDVDYGPGTRTEEKCIEWNKKYPDLQLRYVDPWEIKALPKEDQKLYAEIIYSWLITRIDQIKRNYHADFLFCVVSD